MILSCTSSTLTVYFFFNWAVHTKVICALKVHVASYYRTSWVNQYVVKLAERLVSNFALYLIETYLRFEAGDTAD